MHLRTRRAARLLSVVFLLLPLLCGCKDSSIGKTYPVVGTVYLGNDPLVANDAIVTFVPDKARGNTTPFEPAARVNSNGEYTLHTKTQRGAPPGWYKVTVTATAAPAAPKAKGALKSRPVPTLLVPAEYGQAKSTPLSVEVVENPASGAYDLKLKKE